MQLTSWCRHQKQSQSYGRDVVLQQACSKILIQTCCTEVLPMLDIRPDEETMKVLKKPQKTSKQTKNNHLLQQITGAVFVPYIKKQNCTAL